MYRRILMTNQPWIESIARGWTGFIFNAHDSLPSFSSSAPCSRLASRTRNASRRYRELVRIKGDNIREEETRLSCQKEMKTELSVTERCLHGSNSFRFNCSTLIRPRFSFHFSDFVPSSAEIFWSRLLRSPAPYVAYELWARAISF